MTSADTLCKQFGLRSGLTECQTWSGSKLFNTNCITKRIFWKRLLWKKNQQTAKNHEKFLSMQRVKAQVMVSVYNIKTYFFIFITNKAWYFMWIVSWSIKSYLQWKRTETFPNVVCCQCIGEALRANIYLTLYPCWLQKIYLNMNNQMNQTI